MIKTLALVFGYSLTLKISAAADGAFEPLRLHPENPHYFLFRGKPTALISSGEHYGAVLNQDFDYLAYLDTLRAEGMNLTRELQRRDGSRRRPEYIHSPRKEPRAGALMDLPNGRWHADWLHPATGEWEPTRIIDHPGGGFEVKGPAFDFDIALRIRRVR